MSTHPFIVAIDPGSTTGVAIFSRKQNRILGWYSKDFYTVQPFLVNSFADRDEAEVYIEIPQTMLYARNESSIRKEELTIMYHAGGNRREALLLSGTLKMLGFDVTEVPPIRKTKWGARKMFAATGSNARSNEHERDSVRLALHYADKTRGEYLYQVQMENKEKNKCQHQQQR